MAVRRAGICLAKNMPQTWGTIAWEGVTARVPAEWSLVGVSGDAQKGYLRVDSSESSVLEMRWSTAQGKPPELLAKARELLANLDKSCRKQGTKLTSKIKNEGQAVAFWWKTDRVGEGRLTYCDKCDRVLIAQVIYPCDEDFSDTAQSILRSIRDHRSDGLVGWALYGLEFAVPPSYSLEKHTLMSGYLQLVFRNHAKRLIVERWGLANSLLGDDSLMDWYRKDVLPDIKGFRVEFGETEILGHQALRVFGWAAGIRQAIKTAAYSLTLYTNPKLLTGYAWQCTESNRLYSVRTTHDEGENIAERVRDLIRCHK
ncbi:MAG: hypothetical protein QHI38_08325 [Armatimonadota bacterium]|nr:hypothetical protein [Armatimonadota bacterium]